jgi:imidazolonepropionase-like amidohydrolase
MAPRVPQMRTVPLTEGVLFSHANVLDVVAGTYVPDRFVLVRDGRIVDISGARPAWDGAAFDLNGRVLMPGLCDGHVHVTAISADFATLTRMPPSYVTAKAAPILRGMLMRGFTTVRDAGGADFGLAQAVEEALLPGPRILFCGHALSQTGGHGDVRGPGENNLGQCFCCAGFGLIADGVDALRRACREEIRKGATQIKLMVSGGVASPTDRIDSTQFSVDELRAAVEEAEAANIPVMAHAYTARAINRALRCGVDSIEHGNLLDDSSVALFRETGKFLVPTLSTYRAIADEGLAVGMPPAQHAKIFQVLDAGLQALERAHRGGVTTVYGSDLLGPMHRHQLLEFALRGEVQSPIDVIRAATVNAAALFRRTGELGVIAPGARADLLVVEGDPLRDLAVLRDPKRNLRAILKDGVFVRNDLADL